jgi:hypothetical protein
MSAPLTSALCAPCTALSRRDTRSCTAFASKG